MRQRHVLDGRDGSGKHRQAKVQAQGREHDEHAVEQDRRALEDKRRVRVAADHVAHRELIDEQQGDHQARRVNAPRAREKLPVAVLKHPVEHREDDEQGAKQRGQRAHAEAFAGGNFAGEVVLESVGARHEEGYPWFRRLWVAFMRHCWRGVQLGRPFRSRGKKIIDLIIN